jgi:hypothetical protein
MDENAPDIVILEQRVEPAELARLVHLHFDDMVKYVRDRVREITFALIGGGEPLP